jgi:hypothetical protein
MFTLPNAIDTTGGNRYESLDQAEPDGLDFEILSNVQRSGVLSGCEVTSIGSATAVAVSAGLAVVDGVTYTVAGTASLALPVAPADNRYDIVVVRVSAGVASLVVVQGPNSALNPTFPRSTSRITGSFSPTTNIDFDTDVPLAALYRSGAGVITSTRIVDKRPPIRSGIHWQGTTEPPFSASGPGEFYYRTAGVSGTSSGVYVSKLDGTWLQLAADVGSHVPVGTLLAYLGEGPIPEDFIELGTTNSVDAYPDLFALWGYKYGGSGANFSAPSSVDVILRGTNVGTSVGTIVGSDTVTLAEANIPSHVHGMKSHTHGYSHSHGIDHDHPNVVTDTQGSHQHGGPSGGGILSTTGTVFPGQEYGIPAWQNYQVAAGKSFAQVRTDGNGVTANGSHQHSADVPNYSGSTTSQSASTTGGPNDNNTTAVGSGTAISVQQRAMQVRWIVRAKAPSTGSGGTSAPLRIVNKNATFTLDIGDKNALLVCANAAQMDIDIPLAPTHGFSTGESVLILQNGAGAVRIDPAVGVTVTAYDAQNATAGPGAGASLVYLGSNTWWLEGNLTTV